MSVAIKDGSTTSSDIESEGNIIERGGTVDQPEEKASPSSDRSWYDRPWSFGCALKRVVLPLVALAVLITLIAYFVGGNETIQSIIPDSVLAFRQEDPFDGDIYSWRSAGSNAMRGLELTLINALDTEWHPFFDLAVEQWDNGSPDTLTLSTQTRPPDPSCSPVTGLMKVCNGDYGATGWKGVNELLLRFDNTIASSVAKMNEHFFAGARDDDKRQYTMCHEIGKSILSFFDEQRSRL
jgi:hypothetical protein